MKLQREHLGWLALLAVLIWTYAVSFTRLADTWAHDPDYSHGFLVPLFSGFLLWQRRDIITGNRKAGSWWGLALVVFAAVFYFCSIYFAYDRVAPYSLLPCLAGVAVLAGGWPALRWTWPAILFLFFMIQPPDRIAMLMRQPLQQMATICATYILQVLGVPAVAEGNVVHLSETSVGVVEACSGLRMLIMFGALSTAIALIVDRPLWEKLVIVASAFPIAVLSNVARITVTAGLHEMGAGELANTVFHDLAGWLMMPLALGMLWLELFVLSRLFLDEEGPLAVQ